LVLGAKCSNGVTVIADTKITGHEDTFFGHQPKLFGELTNTIFGCAGTKDMVQLFRKYVLGDVISLRDSLEKYTDKNLMDNLKKIMLFFREVRDGRVFVLTVMVARILPLSSDLHVVDSLGRIDFEFNHPWKTIGSGAPDADVILEGEWRDDMTMKQFASLSYSVIRYIEKQKPKGKVGVGDGKPNIRYLPNGAIADNEPSVEEWSYFEKSYLTYRLEFKKYILGDG
jgi:20S proteasome alpha/beta subunit